MHNKYILLIIILLFLFGGTLYYTNYNTYSKKYDILLGEYVLKEQYENNSIENENTGDNIILNGNFEYGKDITNKIGGNSYNKIVTHKNPGSSSYVLKQASNVNYYELSLNLDAGKTYQLSFWFMQTNTWDITLSNIINIKYIREKTDDKLISTNGTIVEKKEIDNYEWYKIIYIFTVPDDTIGKSLLYLSYNNNKTIIPDAFRYFTDISIIQYLKNAPSFPLVNGLVSYISACNKNSYKNFSTRSKDLSNYGNDFDWGMVAKLNENMYFETLERRLTGPTFEKMGIKNSSSFSIIIHARSNKVSQDIHYSIIEMSPNSENGLQLKIPSKIGSIIVTIGNKTFTTNETLISTNDFIIILIYRENKKTNEYTFELWIDGTQIFANIVGKIFLDTSNIFINYNKDWDGRLYNLLFYNKALTENDITILLKHLKSNCGEYINKELNEIDVNNVLFEDGFSRSIDDKNNNIFNTEIDELSNSFLLQNDKSSTRPTVNGNIRPPINEDEYNKYNKYDKYSKYDEYSKYDNNGGEDKGEDRYEYIDKKDDIYTQNAAKKEYRKYMKYIKNVNYHKCPIVFKQNGNYMVHIKDNSIYSKKLGISGKKSYGPDIKTAKRIYKINFPDCRVPDILNENKIPVDYNRCPFIVNKHNPCFEKSCKNINLNDENMLSNASSKCKKAISFYCEMNSDIDETCLCWKKENKNLPECKKLRRKIEDPADYNCNVDSFNIEEHSDINKYILKNKIPCYGCTLDAPLNKNDENEKNEKNKVKENNIISQNNNVRSWNNYTK